MKVSRFLIVPERLIKPGQKCVLCKAAQHESSELHHTASANQTHCLQMTQFDCFMPNFGT